MDIKKILPFALVAVVLALGIYLSTRDTSTNEEVTACTMEALLCPDGSAVGRQGPSCEFTPCPAVASISGILRQNGEDITLVLGTIQGGPEEVEYSVPLRFSRISNVVSQFVGKPVSVTGDFVMGNLLDVSTIELISTENSTSN